MSYSVIDFLKPKRATDPLSLRRRSFKRTLVASMSIGAATLCLWQVKERGSPGEHRFISYVERITHGDDGLQIRDVIPCATVIFLTSGTTYNRPGDWNPNANSVECIGGGQAGFLSFSCGCCSINGPGGTGGGYAKSSNLNIGATTSYAIGAGGASNGTTGGNTTFNSSAIVARGGGTGTTQVGAITRLGGAGGSGGGPDPGCGGGGAAGPNAAGNAGSAAASLAGGAGGRGDGTFGGTGGAGGSGLGGAGAPGNPGAEYTATAGGTAGSGGGGGGAAFQGNGGNGGLYGGGGGGQSRSGTGSVGSGAQGIIVITYTPQWVLRTARRQYLRR